MLLRIRHHYPIPIQSPLALLKRSTINMNRNQLLSVTFLFIILSSCTKEDVGEQTPPKPTPAPVTMRLQPFTTAIGNNIGGYYVAKPSDYDSTTTRLPLLIFLPGAGQFGNGNVDLPLLLNDGPVQLVDEKKFPATFTVNGTTYSFILFTPQFKNFASINDVKECINFLKTSYRIDTTRIYISGLSSGAELATEVAAAMPGKLAAIVPLAGVFQDYATTNKCGAIAAANLPVWAFHCQDDPIYPIASVRGFVQKINSFNPGVLSKITVWPSGGHDAWTRAIEPAYKEAGMNIYEWMLQFKR